MDIKSLILIAGGVMIVAVILHGVWIAWRSRRDTIRMDIIQDSLLDDPEADERFPAELPNGGARVVASSGRDPRSESPPILMTPTGEIRGGGRAVPAGVNAELLGAEDLLTTENRTDSRNGSSRSYPERTNGTARTRNGYHPGANGQSTIEAAMSRQGAVNVQRGHASTETTVEVEAATVRRNTATQRSRVAEVTVPAAPKPVKKRESLRDRVEETIADEEADGTVDESTVVSFYLVARNGSGINGTDLLDIFRKKGIKAGEMSIFHRVDTTSKMSLYSVANAVNPGMFDFANMATLKVPGVVFFMRLEGLDHPVRTFDDMRRVLCEVAQVLKCDIKDENRSVVTAQTFDHYRERIADYARRRLSRRAL
jgi:cell division protein ZipA